MIILFFPLFAFGIVDTRSAGYSKTFTDFKAKSGSSLLKLNRTYNSRSIYNGLFGFGWCSNFETRLTILPDHKSIKIIECGAGREIVYHPKGNPPNVKLFVKKILNAIQAKKIKMQAKALSKLKKDLLQSPNLRSLFLKELNLKGKIDSKIKYLAKGRGTEYVFSTSRGFVRKMPNGEKQIFNKSGRLIEISDGNKKIEISWGAKQIRIIDQKGQRLTFVLNLKNEKIQKLLFNKKTYATYKYASDNLKHISQLHTGDIYQHKYDGFHNLIKTTYPDKSTEELQYNERKDWVISFKDRKKCIETYSYGMNKKNSDHYFSTVKKECNRVIVHSSKYEFWHKTNSKGGKYLHRARKNINQRVVVDVVYHPMFGTPISFLKNGVRTKRKYYTNKKSQYLNGLLKEKSNLFQRVRYLNYHAKCRKPQKVHIAYKNPSLKKKNKIVRKETIRLHFDKKCQLAQAIKSKDEWIKVRHDSQKRIVYMEDQSRKKILLNWHKTLNKPSLITRKGVGSIRLIYNDQGAVKEIRHLKNDPTVITQVVSVFNNFLKTLSPISEEMIIL